MEDFFDNQTASSRIKANIVAEYFPQYCRIILKKPQQEIRYIDLFAGPGIYKDKSHSTPMLIGKACANDPNLVNKVHLMFNDNTYSEELKTNFLSYFPTKTFGFEPKFGNKTVGENGQIQNYLTKNPVTPNPHPTLLFFDPWGYKGIDTLALAKFLENWGNEIFLFVNIKRIHAATENGKFDDLMRSLFPTTIDKLRQDRKYKSNVYERLSLIMENLSEEFKKATKGGIYHCSFKFKEEDSNATSHFIIHFTKHSKGYELVKQVYNDFDNIGAVLEREGTYTFDAKKMDVSSTAIDFGDQNIESLAEKLTEMYKGKTINAKTLYEQHHPTTQYCHAHYAKALRFLVDQGSITSTFSDQRDHKVSVLLNNNCTLTFN